MTEGLGVSFDEAVSDDEILSVAFAVQRQPFGYNDDQSAFPETESFREIARIEKSHTLEPAAFLQRVQDIILEDLDKIANGELNRFIQPEDLYLVSYAVTVKHGWFNEDEHSAIIDIKKPASIKGNQHLRAAAIARIEDALLNEPIDKNAGDDEIEINSLVRAYADFFKRVSPERAAQMGLSYDRSY